MFEDTKPQVQSRGASLKNKAQEQTRVATERILKDISPELEVNKFSDGSISASFKNATRNLDFVPNVDKSHGPILECKLDPESIKVSSDGKSATIDLMSVDKVGINDRMEITLALKYGQWSPEKVKVTLSDGEKFEGKEVPIRAKVANEQILNDLSSKLEVTKVQGGFGANFRNCTPSFGFLPNADERHGPLLECKLNPESIKISNDGKTATIQLETRDKLSNNWGPSDIRLITAELKNGIWSPTSVKLIISDYRMCEEEAKPIRSVLEPATRPNLDSLRMPRLDPQTETDFMEIQVLDIGPKSSSAPHVVASAIGALEAAGGLSSQNWEANTEKGKVLLSQIKTANSQLNYLPEGTLESVGAVGDPGPVNKFLKDNGFDIQLSKSSEDGLYGASVFNAKGTFLQPGKTSEIELESGKVVPAATIPSATVAGIYRSESHDFPIVALATKEGLTAYVTKVGADGVKGNVMEFVKRISSDIEIDRGYRDITGVNIPMADYQVSGDLEKLIGLRNGSNQIDQAKYGHSFKLDESGFEAKVVAAAGTSRGFSKELDIDSDYVVWISTDRNIVPFAARIGEDDMKDPKLAVSN